MYPTTVFNYSRIQTLLLAFALIALSIDVHTEPLLRYPAPAPLVSPGFAYQQQMENAFSDFLPIGWSRDCQFAFLKQSNTGGGCGDRPYFVVTVQNLVTE